MLNRHRRNRCLGLVGQSGGAAPGPIDPPPDGFVYLLGADGAYLKGADGAFLLGVAP